MRALTMALVVCLLPAVGAAQPADLVLINGRVYTLDFQLISAFSVAAPF